MVVAKPWARRVRGYKTASLAGPLWPCLLSCPPRSLDRGALYDANTQSCSEASRQTGYSTTPYLVSSCSSGLAHGPALLGMSRGSLLSWATSAATKCLEPGSLAPQNRKWATFEPGALAITS